MKIESIRNIPALIILAINLVAAQSDGISVNQEKVGINNLNPQKTLEISAENDPTLRLSQGASTTDFFDLIDATTTSAHLRKYTSTGNSLIDIDPYPLDGTSESGVRLFRAINTTNRVSLQVMQGNNTAAVNHLLAGNRDSYLSAHAGNVGIGLTTPTEKLDITGNIAISNTNFLMGKRTDGTKHQLVGMDGGNSLVVNRSSIVGGMPSNLILGVGQARILDVRNSSNVTLMRVDEATGNIGIGTTTMWSKVHIKNPLDEATDQFGGVRIDPAKPAASVVRVHDNYQRISGFRRSGLWLGGSTSGNQYLLSNIMLRDDGILFGMSDGLSDPEQNVKFFVGNGGKVGIGTTTPTQSLDVVGNIKASGTITPSDIRLKKDITDFKMGIESLLQLNPVSFTYNGEAGTINGSKHIGLIAQDVQKIIPDFVQEFSHTKEGKNTTEKYLEIKNSEIPYLLINAIKDQQEIISSLKRIVENQQEEIAEMKNMVRTYYNELSSIKKYDRTIGAGSH